MPRRSQAGRSTTSRTRSFRRRSSCWSFRSSVWTSTRVSSKAPALTGDSSSRSLVALAVSVVLVLAVPKVRARVLPGLRDALLGLWSVARVRRKRLEVFGGSIASELLYAVALGATCLAYGVHLNLGQLIFINTSASVLSGVVPVPGGIGAAEAALSAGLIAMGVDQSTAFAIAITQRLCTFYLPPIWGYFSLRWLGEKGYL